MRRNSAFRHAHPQRNGKAQVACGRRHGGKLTVQLGDLPVQARTRAMQRLAPQAASDVAAPLGQVLHPPGQPSRAKSDPQHGDPGAPEAQARHPPPRPNASRRRPVRRTAGRRQRGTASACRKQSPEPHAPGRAPASRASTRHNRRARAAINNPFRSRSSRLSDSASRTTMARPGAGNPVRGSSSDRVLYALIARSSWLQPRSRPRCRSPSGEPTRLTQRPYPPVHPAQRVRDTAARLVFPEPPGARGHNAPDRPSHSRRRMFGAPGEYTLKAHSNAFLPIPAW